MVLKRHRVRFYIVLKSKAEPSYDGHMIHIEGDQDIIRDYIVSNPS
jgi:hypothetical protein